MASAETVAPFIASIAKLGYDVGEAHEAELVQMVENVADPDAKQMMDTLAQNLVMHGLAGTFENAARSDITNSETDIVSILNANIKGGADAMLAWLQKVGSGQ